MSNGATRCLQLEYSTSLQDRHVCGACRERGHVAGILTFSNLSGKMSLKVEETKLMKVMKVYVLNNMTELDTYLWGGWRERLEIRETVGSCKIL